MSTEATTSRRSSRNDSEESGGGKIFIIVLLIALAGLGFAYFKQSGSATGQAETDAKSITSFSNQVDQLNTKLKLGQSDMEIARSNHQASLDRRTGELLNTSNRLVQTRLLLERAEQETRIAQGEIPAKAVAVVTMEAQRDEFARQAAVIPGLQQEIAGLKEKFNQAQFAQAALQESLGRVTTEKAELERRIEDPLFLRFQEKKVLEAAEMRQRVTAGQRAVPSDPRVRLELQPDGTVRPAVTAAKARP